MAIATFAIAALCDSGLSPLIGMTVPGNNPKYLEITCHRAVSSLLSIVISMGHNTRIGELDIVPNSELSQCMLQDGKEKKAEQQERHIQRFLQALYAHVHNVRVE